MALSITWFGNVRKFFFSLKIHVRICHSPYGELSEKFSNFCLLPLSFFLLVLNYGHIVFVYVIIIIFLNLCLTACRLALDWYSMTTGNGDNRSKNSHHHCWDENPLLFAFFNLPQLESFDICWFGTWLNSCQQWGSCFQQQLAGWQGASLYHLCAWHFILINSRVNCSGRLQCSV